MHFKASRSYIRLVEGPELVLGVYCCQRYVKYDRLPSRVGCWSELLSQEYPDRMVATFSILPSPKVSMKLVGFAVTWLIGRL